MKKNLLWLLGLGVLAVIIAIAVKFYDFHATFGSTHSSVSTIPLATASHPIDADTWSRYHAERENTLRSAPTLQRQYQAILQTMNACQTGLDSAMLKVDPKLAPVLAKLQILRAQHGADAGASGSYVSAPSPTLTPDEVQELQSARNEALRSHSDVMAQLKKSTDDMRAFERQLDVAMIKTDPSMQPIIATFEGRNLQGAFSSVAPSK